MSPRTALITFGVVAAFAGGGATIASAAGDATIAGAAGDNAQSRAEPTRALSANARGHEYRKHRRECLRERRTNPRDFRQDHGTLKRCIAQERRADANDE